MKTRAPLIHALLQTRCVVIPDMKVGYVAFNSQGFRELDSLDTPVQIEGQIVMSSKESFTSDEIVDQSQNASDEHPSQKLVSGTLRQFIENVESRRNKKVLRIVRMPSEAPPGYTPFGSEFVAWRETKSRVHCKQEDPSLIKLLAWNDITTQHATQWWSMTPHGFGLAYDVREGCQWIVIGTPPQNSNPSLTDVDSLHYFAQPNFWVPSFPRMHHTGFPMDTEAMLLNEGMRMYVFNSSNYRTIEHQL